MWQGKQVAVKSLLRSSTSKRVEEEATLLVRVKHPNVVILIVCAFNEEKKSMIVMELMDQDLHYLVSNIKLLSPNEPPFNFDVALEIMLKVATAMNHFRNCNVLHRDLTTTNKLINARTRSESGSSQMLTSGPETSSQGFYYDVKLSDFGLSKYKEGDATFATKASEAQLWRTPETSYNYSWPADVLSFAVVCYGILSGKVPLKGMQGPELLKLVRDGERPEVPAYCPPAVAALVNACWATNPEDRPDFAQVCSRLEACSSVQRNRAQSLLIELQWKTI